VERLRTGDPEQIGPWQIVNRLGAGGMGIVYMGTNGTRAAAIKIVRDFLLEDAASRSRLGREVASLKKVKSKYVAEIVGADIDATPAWIATNYVDGPSLKTLIENEGPLSEQKWFELAFGLMSALSSVHTAGVIHRDIKPSNILMSASGPKVIDFGISFSSDATALTRTGMVAGTPSWFAPEQFEGSKVTGAVDNFAAGSVLYFAATGNNPWGRDDTSVANTMHMILNKEADMSDLTESQKEVISLLHKKSPKERSNADEILARLEHLNQNLGHRLGGNSEGISKIVNVKSRTGKIALLASAITLTGLALYGYQSGMLNTDKKPAAAPSPTIEKSLEWRLQVVGDANFQKGQGDSYTTFICDQGVIKDSLQIRELTNPPATKQPTIKLISGDPKCGKDFDTILVSGVIDNLKKTREYVIAGSTKTGFIIQYEYSITVTN
jgi:serine/threonine protein kinase